MTCITDIVYLQTCTKFEIFALAAVWEGQTASCFNQSINRSQAKIQIEQEQHLTVSQKESDRLSDYNQGNNTNGKQIAAETAKTM